MKSTLFLCGLLATACAAAAQQYVINTIAGIPQVQGYQNDANICNCPGTATQAQFAQPAALAIGKGGNLFVSDLLNNVVRQITPAGVISSIAGVNATGIGFTGDGGPGTSALINNVQGLGADAAGNIYLGDTGNSAVRRVDPKDTISTFAGYLIATGTTNERALLGYNGDGGPATRAQVARPAGVAADAAGNVYIADYGNLTVRKVDTKLVITTLAGNGNYGDAGDGGPAKQATLGAPFALAVDPAGNIFVLDNSFHTIREITTDGNIHTVAGSVIGNAIAVDAADNVYYPDLSTNTVQKIPPSGVRVTIAGNGTQGYSGDGGVATFAQLNQPQGIAVDSSGNVYVADTGNFIIRELTPTTPPFSVGSVVNAASNLVQPVAPGEIVILYGTGLGPATLVANQPVNGVFGGQVGGTQVFFGGVAAPILYSSATQVAAIVPWGQPLLSTAEVTLVYNGQQAATVPVPIGLSGPGIFTLNQTGTGQASAINLNGTVNGPSNPIAVGSYISLYMTGGGQTTPILADGQLAPLEPPFAVPTQTVTAMIGGRPAQVTYAGVAPGEVNGVMQVNVQIPAGLQAGSATPVTVQVGSASSQAGVTIAVSAQ